MGLSVRASSSICEQGCRHTARLANAFDRRRSRVALRPRGEGAFSYERGTSVGPRSVSTLTATPTCQLENGHISLKAYCLSNTIAQWSTHAAALHLLTTNRSLEPPVSSGLPAFYLHVVYCTTTPPPQRLTRPPSPRPAASRGAGGSGRAGEAPHDAGS